MWLFHDASWQQYFRLCILAVDPADVVAVYFFGVGAWHGVKAISAIEGIL
ncbi:MAG: hypothetical protein ACTHM5_02360 [Ginsengibacter sp.]